MNVVQTVLLLCNLYQRVSVCPTNRIELQLQKNVVQYVRTMTSSVLRRTRRRLRSIARTFIAVTLRVPTPCDLNLAATGAPLKKAFPGRVVRADADLQGR